MPSTSQDLIGNSVEDGALPLPESLTTFVNFTLMGKTQTSASPFFFGASLIALEKNDGGYCVWEHSLTLGSKMCSPPRQKTHGRYSFTYSAWLLIQECSPCHPHLSSNL